MSPNKSQFNFSPITSYSNSRYVVNSAVNLLKVGSLRHHLWIYRRITTSQAPVASFRLEKKILLQSKHSTSGDLFFNSITRSLFRPRPALRSALQLGGKIHNLNRFNSVNKNRLRTHSTTPFSLTIHTAPVWKFFPSLSTTSHDLLGSLPDTKTWGEMILRWSDFTFPHVRSTPRRIPTWRKARHPHPIRVLKLASNPLLPLFNKFLQNKTSQLDLSLVTERELEHYPGQFFRVRARPARIKGTRAAPRLRAYQDFNLSFSNYKLKPKPSTFFKPLVRVLQTTWRRTWRRLRRWRRLQTRKFRYRNLPSANGFIGDSKAQIKKLVNNYPVDAHDDAHGFNSNRPFHLRKLARQRQKTLAKLSRYVRLRVATLRGRKLQKRFYKHNPFRKPHKPTRPLNFATTLPQPIVSPALKNVAVIPDHLFSTRSKLAALTMPLLSPQLPGGLRNSSRMPTSVEKARVKTSQNLNTHTTRPATMPTRPSPTRPKSLPLPLKSIRPSSHLNSTLTFSLPSLFNSNAISLSTPNDFNLIARSLNTEVTRPAVLKPSHSITFSRSMFFFTQLLSYPFESTIDVLAEALTLRVGYSYHIFPDANSIKVDAFRSLNNQKNLFKSRVECFNEASLNLSSSFSENSPYYRLHSSPSHTLNSAKHFFRTIYPLKSIDEYVQDEVIHIKRIRFKPGYGRLWRVGRTSIRELTNLPCRYQYRLSPKLLWLYMQERKFTPNYFFMSIDQVLMSSHLLPDYWCVKDALSANQIFLNGRLAKNRNMYVFMSDFLQLTVNLRFYIMLKWLRYWSNLRVNRVNRVFYAKHRPSGTNRYAKYTRPLPYWFFGLRFSYRDVPQNLEVDFFTLSIFVIRDALLGDPSEPTRANLYDSPVLNMYNWKYIN